MNKGKNIFNESFTSFSKSANSTPCVFLSHKSEDKTFVKTIGEYLTNSGLNIYLDENDVALQQATKSYDSKKITECIEKGISISTHMLCIVSDSTVKSWWVPYELGYGKKSKLKLTTLKRKGTEIIPDYLKVEEIIESKMEINQWIIGIHKDAGTVLNESAFYEAKYSLDAKLEKSASSNHPLNSYLK
jgi:hypothetical protein